jgi:carboxyl-terminal processing protease
VKGKKIGVVRFATFSQGSSDQLRKQIDKELKAGAKGLIFDLRGNGGGILTEGVSVASIFLPKNELVVSTNGRTQPPQKLFSTGGQIKDVPVVVLVDGNTASASEIVAGALRDHNRAEIVGTKTFGKGVFQELKPLSNDGLLRLTVGQFFLPKGENLGGDGIDPQVKAQDNPKTPADETLAVGERELLKKLQ